MESSPLAAPNLRTWSGLVRIDNVTWSWLGGANDGTNINNATLMSTKVTPTRTVFVYQTEKMDLAVTFLSPIEPSDPVRQSLPFTYVAFEANSTDGKAHDVQIYSDVGADWIAQSPFACSYSWKETEDNVFCTSTDRSGAPLAESANQATDITLYYATHKISNMATRFGSEKECYLLFSESGPPGLSTNKTIPGHVNVFSMAYDVGSITTTSSPIVWTLGIVRNPVLSYYIDSRQSQLRYPYYASQYTKIGDIIDFVLSDFPSALNRAIAFDNKVLVPASAISTKYADLVSLSVRQTIGSTELTISKSADGGWNISDVKAFMKDVGTSRRVNPVEVLYASFPCFLFVDPSYGGKLLAPLLEFQGSASWTQAYSVRDLGNNYPNTTAILEAHNQGVEREYLRSPLTSELLNLVIW
ncbi:hypothetical protein NLI96_g8556 [Meripilus lineatus]|uniref:Uncharacterized protein n=1 Tax=Meripilus lineatus TaxID=2056292 RepID=A0AAD5YG59_9APHY|nr:hypothetical protein NLI96_g8556 [Physisporinus lineatus]